MKFTRFKPVPLRVGLLIAVFVIAGVLGFWNTLRLQESEKTIGSIHDALDLTRDSLLGFMDVGARQRDFVFEGTDSLLGPYADARERSEEQLDRLDEITRKLELPAGMITQLRELADARVAVLNHGIELRKQGMDQVVPYVMARQGKKEMDDIRQQLSSIGDAERQLLVAAGRRGDRSYLIATLTNAFVTLLGLGVAWSLADGLRREAATNRENDQLYVQLQDQDRRKDEFLATLAHELRNPLAPMRSTVETLSRRPQVDVLFTQLPVMRRQVDHMVRLVDDLFEVARMARGDLRIESTVLDFNDVLRHAAAAAKPKMVEAGVQFDLAIPESPVWVKGDEVRLSQVLANLLGNASKYTPAGGFVSLQAEAVEGAVEVRVVDSGVGIDKEMLPRVFDLFTQGDRDRRAIQQGLGIGLSIVRRLVELHHGTVEAQSDGLGSGSRFIVRLPTTTETLVKTSSVAAVSEVIPSPILIVDDNRDAADALAMLLEAEGAEVHVAYDGFAALQKLDTVTPAVVLLDLAMPVMSGFEVARKIRQRPHGADIRLVALTGWGQQEDREKVAAAGFDGHLVKPVNLDQVRAALTNET